LPHQLGMGGLERPSEPRAAAEVGLGVAQNLLGHRCPGSRARAGVRRCPCGAPRPKGEHIVLDEPPECRRRQGRTEESRAHLEECRRLIDERGFRGFSVVLAPMVWAQLHLDLAERASGAERAEALRDARWGCRATASSARIAIQAAPAALRLRGTYEWLRGNAGRARRAWRRSAEQADALGARYDLALTELEAGRWLQDGARIARAEAILEEIGGSPHVAVPSVA
jgi:hypothetical protein